MRVPVDLHRCTRLLNHGPTTLITAAAAGGPPNVMAAAWVMALDFTPPKLAVVIAADSLTRSLVDASGEMVVSVPTFAQLDLVDAVGTSSGRDADKFQTLAIASSPASLVAAPLIDGCAAWLECRVIPEPHMQEAYDLFAVEVIAAWADDQVFDGARLRPDLPDPLRSVHHLAGGNYALTGRLVAARAGG